MSWHLTDGKVELATSRFMQGSYKFENKNYFMMRLTMISITIKLCAVVMLCFLICFPPHSILLCVRLRDKTVPGSSDILPLKRSRVGAES